MSQDTNKLNNPNKISTQLGRDYLYVCQNAFCQTVEKEFALHSRNQKHCSSCGSTSIKSQLVDTYNWVSQRS